MVPSIRMRRSAGVSDSSNTLSRSQYRGFLIAAFWEEIEMANIEVSQIQVLRASFADSVVEALPSRTGGGSRDRAHIAGRSEPSTVMGEGSC